MRAEIQSIPTAWWNLSLVSRLTAAHATLCTRGLHAALASAHLNMNTPAVWADTYRGLYPCLVLPAIVLLLRPHPRLTVHSS
jgi:hypothetical protein